MERWRSWLTALGISGLVLGAAFAGPQTETASARLWLTAQCGWTHVHQPGSNLSYSDPGNSMDADMKFWGRNGVVQWTSPEYNLPNAWLRTADDYWNANIRLWNGYYGWTGWSGLAVVPYCESWYGEIYFNMSYLHDADWPWRAAVGCQEAGHLFGLDHEENGCMAWGYYNTGGYYNWQPDPGDKWEVETYYPMAHG